MRKDTEIKISYTIGLPGYIVSWKEQKDDIGKYQHIVYHCIEFATYLELSEWVKNLKEE